MQVTEYTKTGTVTRTLSALEVQTLAESGNEQARREILRTELSLATTDTQKVAALLKAFGP